jgi:hypothetical protein
MPMFFVGNKQKTKFNLPKPQPIEHNQINTPRNSGFNISSPSLLQQQKQESYPVYIDELQRQGKEVHIKRIHQHVAPQHTQNYRNPIYYDNKGLIPHPFVYEDYEDFARTGTASTIIDFTYEKPFNHETSKQKKSEPVFMNQIEKCDCHGRFKILKKINFEFLKFLLNIKVCSPRKYCTCHACKVPDHVLNKRKEDIVESMPPQQQQQQQLQRRQHHQHNHSYPHNKLCTCNQCLNVNYSKLAIKKHSNDENEIFDWHIPTDRSSKMFKMKH